MFFSDVLLPELPFIFLSFLYCVFQNPLFPVSLSKSVGSVPIYRLIIAIHSSGCLNLCLQKYRKPYIRVRFPVAFSFYRARACLKKAFRELRVLVCGRFYPNEGKIYRKVGLADCGNDFSDTLLDLSAPFFAYSAFRPDPLIIPPYLAQDTPAFPHPSPIRSGSCGKADP